MCETIPKRSGFALNASDRTKAPYSHRNVVPCPVQRAVAVHICACMSGLEACRMPCISSRYFFHKSPCRRSPDIAATLVLLFKTDVPQ